MNDARPTLVLTGASRGIGHATVKRFSAEGWRIVTCSREDVPEECKRDPNWTLHIPVDLGDAAEVDRFVAEAMAALGDAPVAALVNNAAVSPKTAIHERLGCLNGSFDEWRAVFQLNLFTPLALARGFAPALARAGREGGAAIVNITSIAGHAIHPFAGSAYATSKAALSALTREMAVEFAQLGVRVNAVAPGEIETEMIGDEYEPLINRIPMHRMGTADEVASTVFQLCSRDFGYVTGTEVFVTGGQHLY
ncbi:MAG: SDR family oxidoreductase [Alphaproteobacteria bacterium]|nr:SDR family oxidoreductase [Alphaproteobacteria bacterium]